MNRYYNYPHKELWDTEIWKERISPIADLAMEIDRINIRKNRIAARYEGIAGREGIFDPKAFALTDRGVLKNLEAQGLSYYCASMGHSAWVAIVPAEQIGKKGYDSPMDTLIVLVNVDRKDPAWCMYVLEHYNAYVEAASREKFALLFIASDAPDTEYQYISIIQEAIVLFHLNYQRFYLDISVARAEAIVTEGEEKFSRQLIPALNITGKWQNRDSLTHKLIHSTAFSNAAYDKGNIIDTEIGRKLAEGLALEMNYNDAEDPELLKYWEDMGLKCEFHEKKGEQWITFVPVGAFEEPQKKIPVVCLFQEVNRFDPHQAITAFSYCYEYMNIAAQGECMLLFFVLESRDDNDLLHEILDDMEEKYPMSDRSRVYLTGHSHDGRFTAEYARRHPLDLAAIATLGNEPGQIPPQYTSGLFLVTDEQIQLEASHDMPLINISGYRERNSQFPLNRDAPDLRPGQRLALDTFEKRAESWQRRLKSSRCPMKTVEEIQATRESENYVERMLGIPADKTEVLYLDGNENYIADIKNIDGNYHLRIVGLGNMTHTITPAMIDLSWSYMRRFARNRKDGSCIELY